MAAAQDGGAPRDPARVAQFGRRAGAPASSPAPPPPGAAPPPGARRAAESALGAAFVSHRAGPGRRPLSGFIAPRCGGSPGPPAALEKPRHVAASASAGPRGLAAAGTGAKVRPGTASRWPFTRGELVCGLLWECLCEVSIVVAGTV